MDDFKEYFIEIFEGILFAITLSIALLLIINY